MGAQVFNENQPFAAGIQLANANGTTPQAYVSGPSVPLRWDHLLVTNTDTVDHEVQLIMDDFVSDEVICAATVPAGAGSGATPAVDLIAEALPSTIDGLIQPVTATFKVAVVVVITAGKHLNFWGQGGYL